MKALHAAPRSASFMPSELFALHLFTLIDSNPVPHLFVNEEMTNLAFWRVLEWVTTSTDPLVRSEVLRPVPPQPSVIKQRLFSALVASIAAERMFIGSMFLPVDFRLPIEKPIREQLDLLTNVISLLNGAYVTPLEQKRLMARLNRFAYFNVVTNESRKIAPKFIRGKCKVASELLTYAQFDSCLRKEFHMAARSLGKQRDSDKFRTLFYIHRLMQFVVDHFNQIPERCHLRDILAAYLVVVHNNPAMLDEDERIRSLGHHLIKCILKPVFSHALHQWVIAIRVQFVPFVVMLAMLPNSPFQDFEMQDVDRPHNPADKRRAVSALHNKLIAYLKSPDAAMFTDVTRSVVAKEEVDIREYNATLAAIRNLWREDDSVGWTSPASVAFNVDDDEEEEDTGPEEELCLVKYWA